MRVWVVLAMLSLTASARSQMPEPKALPAEVIDGASLFRFNSTQLELKRVENRWQIWAGKELLKDFGPFEREASEALRLIRDMHFTRHGTVAGSTPLFEYWLAEDDTPRSGFGSRTVVPFNPRSLKIEQVTGAWIIRDDRQMLYNFGAQKDAALVALAILQKHGFNQIGIIGQPTPMMTYLTVDSYAHAAPVREPDPREILGKVSEEGLILPVVGHVGRKMPIEFRKLEVVRLQQEWVLAFGTEVLARFGSNGTQAREALRLLQDSHVTEQAFIGKVGFPIYLASGQAPRGSGLGFNNLRLQPALMKVQLVNGVACITENGRIVYEFGNSRADAETVLLVFQHYKFDQVTTLGDVNRGGIRIFTRSK